MTLSSSTDTGYAAQFNLPCVFAHSADFGMVEKAVALCTISDMVFTGECCTTAERQESFIDMITLALEIAQEK